MENEFTKVMSERTDEELIKIVTVERGSYNPNAIEAADAEVEKRKIDTSEFEKIRKKATAEKEQKEKEQKLHFPVYVDSGHLQSRLRVTTYPTAILIDKKGVVRHIHIGATSMITIRNGIDKLLVE